MSLGTIRFIPCSREIRRLKPRDTSQYPLGLLLLLQEAFLDFPTQYLLGLAFGWAF